MKIVLNRGDIPNTVNIATIRGYRMPDELWKKYKAIWYACEEAGIEKPETVYEFFGREEPNDVRGVELNILHAISLSDKGCELDWTKLPKDVTKIRFAISYHPKT